MFILLLIEIIIPNCIFALWYYYIFNYQWFKIIVVISTSAEIHNSVGKFHKLKR